MRVLVVEDHADARLLLVLMLQDLHFTVVEAANGEEALDSLDRAGPFEFALVDWGLPGLSGLDLVREIRAKQESDHMKILMVTGRNEMDDVAEALENGVDEYLMKPFDEDALCSKLLLLGLEGVEPSVAPASLPDGSEPGERRNPGDRFGGA